MAGIHLGTYSTRTFNIKKTSADGFKAIPTVLQLPLLPICIRATVHSNHTCRCW